MAVTEAPTTPPTDEQVAFAKERARGLRELADIIEAKPELAGNPYSTVAVYVDADNAEDMARLVRMMGGARTKQDLGTWLRVERDLGGRVFLHVDGRRDEVCEAVVVGTETVEVPDPDAPKVTVEREKVEWRCASILTNSLGLADARANLRTRAEHDEQRGRDHHLAEQDGAR